MPKVEIEQGRDGQWYWHVRAANGEIQFHSEGYTRKADAERGYRDAQRSMLALMSEGFSPDALGEHTPGPWVIHSAARIVVRLEDAWKPVVWEDGKIVNEDAPLALALLRAPTEDIDEDTIIANGMMMAAAPLMRDTLGRLATVLDTYAASHTEKAKNALSAVERHERYRKADLNAEYAAEARLAIAMATPAAVVDPTP